MSPSAFPTRGAGQSAGGAGGAGAPDAVAEIVVFRIGGLTAGMDIRRIREIKKLGGVTPVRRAPAHVRGIINLRGQIVTLIDLRKALSPESAEDVRSPYVMVVTDGAETAGLLVDSVENSLSVEPDSILPPPTNVRGHHGRYFEGIHRTPDRLLPLLDHRKILYPERS